MITSDYNIVSINPAEVNDLRIISDVEISNITLEDHHNLLVFPDSFNIFDRDLGKQEICKITNNDKELQTFNIVGFIGRNNTHLSIHSRFADSDDSDYFLHYMLQKVAQINLFNLQHKMDEDHVFDFLLYLFPSYLKKALNQGVFRQYITHNYNNASVKGTIDINRHIKHNIPFNGNVAYKTREYCYDNDITQLVRHTIEYIQRYHQGAEILKIDIDTQQAVSQIINATQSYNSKDLRNIVNRNLRPIVHPFYNEYAPLQRLCLQILRHEELKYGQEENEIYGILIDAAWLWEEYLAVILQGNYDHYTTNKFYLFKHHKQPIIPDFLSIDKQIVADAKYIKLNEQQSYYENSERANAIYYKTITYMYRFCSHKGYLLYPHPDEDFTPTVYDIQTEVNGINGGIIAKVGMRIPSHCSSYNDFCSRMKQSEKDFIQTLMSDLHYR